eukprot:TRINITY_DN36054_c0_g1_i2.p1 TRINITY_DN36054_c0_g1~~TRINITY_DN36054_c0_g1_i2.p1  ORF type:complete len:346 (+),score=38.27 TRINITY_DN36054_c0_g1_i2:35-1039(+)
MALWFQRFSQLALRFIFGCCSIAVALGGSPSGSCQNPLYQTHWAGKSDIRHLAISPAIQTGLSLCPAYNDQYACCTGSFEVEQQKAFQRWVEHFKEKEAYLKSFVAGMEHVKLTEAFSIASEDQKALFNEALETFQPVLDSYGTCFDTLLEYKAGVLCFTCEPNWLNKVLLVDAGRKVDALRVDDRSNEELWLSCRKLGLTAVEFNRRIGDSMLAKHVKVPYIELLMFRDRIHVAEYMAGLGLIAMRGPNQKPIDEDHATSYSRSTNRSSTERLLSSIQEGLVNPVEDGRKSGFVCSVFPRDPLNGKAGAIARPMESFLSFMVVAIFLRFNVVW